MSESALAVFRAARDRTEAMCAAAVAKARAGRTVAEARDDVRRIRAEYDAIVDEAWATYRQIADVQSPRAGVSPGAD